MTDLVDHPTLDGVCTFIVDCLHKTAPVQDEGYPLIRTPNIGKGRLLLDGVYRVSEQTYETWTQRAVPEPNDLILAREAPAGNVAIVREGERVVLGQRTVHLRPDPAKIDPSFLCYFLLAPMQQGELLAGETGATAKHVNMKDIRRLKLKGLPDMPTQKKLAEILSNYDDLIENNSRRIRLLEDAAQILYKEWFVCLRFPGHEHSKIINGLPDGWVAGVVSDLGQVVTGKTPPTAVHEYFGGDIPFIKTPDMHASPIIVSTDEHLSEKGAKMQEKKFIPANSILVACIGAKLGVVSINATEAQTNQQINTVIPRDIAVTYYAYFTLKGFRERLLAIGGGATMPNVNKSKFESMPIMLPSSAILNAFHESVKSSFEQMRVLIEATRKLEYARNLLLPRLMNGDIAV